MSMLQSFITITVFDESKAWLEDAHMEIFRLLLQENDHSIAVSNPSIGPLMITSQLFKEFTVFEEKSSVLQGLKNKLMLQGIFKTGKLLCSHLFIPVNIRNQHWILLFIDCQRLAFCPINPFSPLSPQQGNLDLITPFLTVFVTEFGLSSLILEVPSFVKRFPTQKDAFNCGVYVLMYMLAFLEPEILGNDMIPYSAMQFRVLMSAWFLTKSKPTFTL